MCGKDYTLFEEEFFKSGSPPRVREGHADTLPETGNFGITPACAGSTELFSLPSLRP